ncbi:MAG TPA: hypothetical protein VIS74_00910, partial [Chthoniobacterales bacterium]
SASIGCARVGHRQSYAPGFGNKAWGIFFVVFSPEGGAHPTRLEFSFNRIGEIRAEVKRKLAVQPPLTKKSKDFPLAAPPVDSMDSAIPRFAILPGRHPANAECLKPVPVRNDFPRRSPNE